MQKNTVHRKFMGSLHCINWDLEMDLLMEVIFFRGSLEMGCSPPPLVIFVRMTTKGLSGCKVRKSGKYRGYKPIVCNTYKIDRKTLILQELRGNFGACK